MKITKKIIAFVMATVMLVLPCVPANASATVVLTQSSSHTVVSGVKHTKYKVYGSSSKHTETATVLQFNPDDGYIPMAFASNAGNAMSLAAQYNAAVDKYGYQVAGVINASFFDTNTGTLTDMLISGGKVSCADVGDYGYTNKMSVVAFDNDGSMNTVESQLTIQMFINGVYIDNGLRFINKRQSVDTNSYYNGRIYYYDTSCGTKADSKTGYEVLCKKLNGTDLVVGETMVGEVVEVYSNTSGTTIGSGKSDYFVLSTASGASHEKYLKNLKKGDKIEIAVNETISGSVEIMENAASVISNIGFLVKNGKDMTDVNSTIGTHSVGTYARWTAFGQKADGTYVFFTSEGGGTGDSSRSLTMKDVAAAMIKLGCKNVIRLDGGASTAMYVSNTGSGSAGYVTAAGRNVADTILIVKKTPGKTNLKAALKTAKDISHTDYTAEELKAIRATYEEAFAVYCNVSSTDAQYAAAAEKLNNLLEHKLGSEGAKVSNGVYITGFNKTIGNGDATIFTSDFNGGTVDPKTANLHWSQTVLLTWDSSIGAYVVGSNIQGAGETTVPTYKLNENQILIAVHDGGTAASATNKELLAKAKPGQVLNIYGIDIESCSLGIAPYVTVTERVDASIYYQTKDKDLRLIGYVDDIEAYKKVTFTLTIDGKKSSALECTTAYSGLYAKEKLYTTEDIYGVDGYFVAYTINDYLDTDKGYPGKEVTFTATYTTVTGETITEERTLTIK